MERKLPFHHLLSIIECRLCEKTDAWEKGYYVSCRIESVICTLFNAAAFFCFYLEEADARFFCMMMQNL